MKTARRTAKELYSDLTQEEIEDIKMKNIEAVKTKKMADQLVRKKERDFKRDERKKLSKEALKELKEKELLEKIHKTQTEYIEFPYLEELNEGEYQTLKQNDNWVVNDAGKRTLIYMKNKKGDKLRYTNRQHLKETKRLKYQNLIQNYKKRKDIGITILEQDLPLYNSKSCDYGTFSKYVHIKNGTNEELLEKYQNDVFRKYKWYGYINRQKAEAKLIEMIKDKFGKDVTIIYGDWSIGHQMKNYISTPNIGLKRKIGEHFRVYNIDEYKTSCINHKTHQRNENMYLPDKRGDYRKKHSILTYEMSNKRKGCINRDNNAVNNMIEITEQYIKDKTRPEVFRRGTKTIKDTNLQLLTKITLII